VCGDVAAVKCARIRNYGVDWSKNMEDWCLACIVWYSDDFGRLENLVWTSLNYMVYRSLAGVSVVTCGQ